MRDELYQLITAIEPFDELERQHQADVLAWIRSGAGLYRLQKPDVPPKHLVSYFVIYDPASHKILLQDHLLAKLWVPAGGHVDPNEDPAETVRRECPEELGFEATFLHDEPQPYFVTVTQTNGQGQHTDVSLWYLLTESEATPLTIEPGKFAEVRWWPVEEILASPAGLFDPQLHRFIRKVSSFFA